MRNLFSPEGFLWRAMDVVTDLFVFSLLWLICSIPIVTLGASTTALYDTIIHCIRYKDGGAYRRFFRTFKSDLGTSVLTTLLWVAVLAIGIISLQYLRALGEENQTFSMLSVGYYILMLIPAGTACWVFPVLSRFTYKFGGLNLTALRLAVGYLPRTFVIVLITIFAIDACVSYILPVCIVPACTMLLWSLFTEPVFAKLGGGLNKPGEGDEDEHDGDSEGEGRLESGTEE